MKVVPQVSRGCLIHGRATNPSDDQIKLKKLLCIIGRSGQGLTEWQAGLDLALTYVAMDIKVWVLLTDGGVVHARREAAGTGDWIELLTLYGADRFLVETESLEAWGMDSQNLKQHVAPIARQEALSLLSQFDLFLSF